MFERGDRDMQQDPSDPLPDVMRHGSIPGAMLYTFHLILIVAVSLALPIASCVAADVSFDWSFVLANGFTGDLVLIRSSLMS